MEHHSRQHFELFCCGFFNFFFQFLELSGSIFLFTMLILRVSQVVRFEVEKKLFCNYLRYRVEILTDGRLIYSKGLSRAKV